MVKAKDNEKQFDLTQSITKSISKSILESMNAMVVVLDSQGRIEQFNQACEAKTGYQFEELKNKAIWDVLIPESVRHDVRQVFNNLVEMQESNEHNNAWITKTGKLLDITWHNSVVVDENNAIHVVGLGIDMTQQRHTQDELSVLQTRHQLHIKNLPIALIDWDTNFSVSAWNPAAEMIFGYSEQEALGQAAEKLIIPDSVKGHVDRIWHEILEKKEGQRTTTVNITKTGNKITCEWYITPLVDSSGEVMGVTSLVQDISDRVTAEEAMRKSEARLSYLLQVAPSVIYTCEFQNGKPVLTFVSKNMEDMFGYDDGFCICEEDFVQKRIYPDDQKEILEGINKVLNNKNKKSYSCEFRFRMPNGKYTWIRDDISLIRNSKGNVVEIVGSWMDISELREAGLREKGLEQRYHDLLETTTDWIWEVDAQGRYTFVSSNVESVLGYKTSEIVGKTPFELMPADEAAHIKNIFQDVIENKAIIKELENWNIAKDGRLVCLLTNGVPILDDKGNLLGYRGVDKDITIRKNNEEVLRRSEEKFRSIVETTAEGFWLIDPASKYTLEVNRALCEMLGYEESEMLGRTPMEFVDDENRKIFKTQMSKIEDTDHRVYEISLKKKNGEDLHTHFNATTLRNDKNEAIAAYAFITDLSQHHKLEKALIDAKEESDRANKAKSSFLSSISHELRTPMNAIMGFAQLLKLNPSGNLSDKQKQAIEHITKAGEHLTELINQVLELSKIEAGEMSLNINEVSLGKVMEDCLALVQPKAEGMNVSIVKNFEVDSLPVLDSDATRLKQVLLNLITNAVKYNIENGRVIISAEELNTNFYRIYVRDTGEGIPEDKQEDVFKPFDRLGKETGNVEGTGIGLTLSKKIMEMLGGDIGFYSHPGKGALFWVDLPIVTKDTSKVQVQDLPHDSFDNYQSEELAKTVLYIEDNPLSMELMRIVLEEFGYIRMLCANTGDEGIQLAQKYHPDLILMDINLPGMNGIEALNVLQKLEDTRDIPVVAVTAAAMPREVTEGMAAGFMEYLVKPIDVKKTIHIISNILELDVA